MVFLVVIFFMSVSFAPLSASNGKLIASRQGDRPSHTISAVNLSLRASAVNWVECPLRDSLLRALVLFGGITAAITELASPFQLLRRVPLAVAWTAVGIAASVDR